jgi:hypothetical protein
MKTLFMLAVAYFLPESNQVQPRPTKRALDGGTALRACRSPGTLTSTPDPEAIS